MAARVVDDLEVIEVQIEQRVRHGMGARPHQRSVEPPLELAARDEPGQRVVTRLAQLFARLVQARGGACDLPLQRVDASRHLADLVARMDCHRNHVDARVGGVQVAPSERKQRIREARHCASGHAGRGVRHLHHGVGEDAGQHQTDADAQNGDGDEDVFQHADERAALIGQAGDGKQVTGAVECEHQQHRAGELDVQRVGHTGQTLPPAIAKPAPGVQGRARVCEQHADQHGFHAELLEPKHRGADPDDRGDQARERSIRAARGTGDRLPVDSCATARPPRWADRCR